MALTVIKYVGMSDIRIMSKEDLLGAGVAVDRDMHWDVQNGWTQVMESPNDDFLLILKKEGTFTVTEGDAKDGENRTIVKHDPDALNDMTNTVSIDDQALVAEKEKEKASSKGK